MIRCEQAERIFDAYADGTLSPSWTAELHAHQLECTDCRRELALIRVCGDVVATDRREPQPSTDFANQVMAAWGQQRRRVLPWPRRVARLAIGLGTAAAAAMVALVILVPQEAPQRPTAVAGWTGQVDVLKGGTQNVRMLQQVGTVLLERMLERMDETVRDAYVSGPGAPAVSELEREHGTVEAVSVERPLNVDGGSTP